MFAGLWACPTGLAQDESLPVLFFDPEFVELTDDEEIDIHLRVENAVDIDGVGVVIGFDPEILVVVNVDDDSTEIRVQPGDLPRPDKEWKNSVDNMVGEIEYVATQSQDRSPMSGDGTVLTIRFKGLNPGDTVLKVTSAQLTSRVDWFSEALEPETRMATMLVHEDAGTVFIVPTATPTDTAIPTATQVPSQPTETPVPPTSTPFLTMTETPPPEPTDPPPASSTAPEVAYPQPSSTPTSQRVGSTLIPATRMVVPTEPSGPVTYPSPTDQGEATTIPMLPTAPAAPSVAPVVPSPTMTVVPTAVPAVSVTPPGVTPPTAPTPDNSLRAALTASPTASPSVGLTADAASAEMATDAPVAERTLDGGLPASGPAASTPLALAALLDTPRPDEGRPLAEGRAVPTQPLIAPELFTCLMIFLGLFTALLAIYLVRIRRDDGRAPP